MSDRTLLERWDQYMADGGVGPKNEEIRRAIAIAQAVEELQKAVGFTEEQRKESAIMRRAEELLEGK